MLVISQQSLYYLFEKHYGRMQLHALRLLTLVEMGLRTMVWALFFALIPSRRPEARKRLRAYLVIAANTLLRKSYWAPVQSCS
jgi:hypothetical protein